MNFHFDDNAFYQTLALHTDYNTCQYRYQDNTYCESEISDLIFPCCETHSEIYHEELEIWMEHENTEPTTPDLEWNLFVFNLLVEEEAKKNNAVFENIPKMPEISEECPVCFEKKEILILPCHHSICCSCFNSLEKEICSMCRCKINFSLIRRK